MAAAVYLPVHGKMFEAVLGGGARLDGRALRAPEAVPLERALVATGFGYFPQRRLQQAKVLTEVIPLVRDIRRGGSAAVDITGMATGRYNAYYERGLHLWDWAAPGLVASEAGLRVGVCTAGRPATNW